MALCPERKRRKGRCTGHGATVILEFLAYDPEKVGGRVTELKTSENVTAMNIPHANIVFDLSDQQSVTAQLLVDGGEVTETIFAREGRVPMRGVAAAP